MKKTIGPFAEYIFYLGAEYVKRSDVVSEI